VERSDTHQLELLLSDGFREGLNPSYGLKTFANRLLSVGWVERSDTHQLHCFAEMKGFARAQPILRADILSFARDDIKPQAARPPLPL
jgi:hypothetical protein